MDAVEPLLIVFVEGPRGTAKTRSILSILLRRALTYSGCRILLARQHRTEVTKTVLLTLEDEVFPAFGLPVPGGAHHQNRSEYVLPNGSVLFPVGISDGMGILSMGMTFAYTAEVLEMTESAVTDILGSMRWMQCPERPLLQEQRLHGRHQGARRAGTDRPAADGEGRSDPAPLSSSQLVRPSPFPHLRSAPRPVTAHGQLPALRPAALFRMSVHECTDGGSLTGRGAPAEKNECSNVICRT